MQVDGDGVALCHMEDDDAEQFRAMDKVKAKGGAMFATSQQIDNPNGLEFIGAAVRAVAVRVASANIEKERKQTLQAELR